ncbi:anaerobic ribonucleoside-triphosphate reductase activating protein [bacterium]|nr:anaerobic ribonucleoside-triphosphate reductase activating protein [bacterium]
MNIAAFQKVSLTDFPGKIAAIIFTQGCNLSCKYCHNPSLISHCIDENVDTEQILSFLEKRKTQLNAVVITGGEPLLQSELYSVIVSIRKLGYHIKIDTNGTLPNQLHKLLQTGCIDYVAMDFKADNAKWPILTGNIDLYSSTLESLNIIANSSVPFEIRLTLAPQFHCNKTLYSMAEILKKFKDSTIFLQTLSGQVTHDISWKTREPFSYDELYSINKKYFFEFSNCQIRV